MVSQGGRYQTLDAWRGICATLVMLFHFPITSHVFDLALIRHAYLFVDFFFVLSGFIMAHAYYVALQNGFGFTRFTILRFGRVYPLHFFVIVLFVMWDLILLPFGIAPFQDGHSVNSLATNLLLLNSIGINDGLTWNYPSWSIGAEFLCYVVFGSVVVVLARRSEIVFAAALILSVAALYMAPSGIGSHYDFGFFRALYGFCLGFFSWKAHLRWSTWRRGGGNGTLTIRTGLEVVAVVGAFLYVTAPLGFAARLATPLFFCAVVFVFAHERGHLSRLLSLRPFTILGDLSYSIYMIHAFVIYRLIDLYSIGSLLSGKGDGVLWQGERRIIAVDPLIGDVIHIGFALLVIGLAFLTYRYVERPGRAFFRQVASAQNGKPIPQVAGGG